MLIHAPRVRAALAATLLLVGGCRSQPSNPQVPSPAASAPGATVVHGVDTRNLDRAVDPGDDFYAFANGAWMARTEIPSDRSTWGPSEQLTEEAAARTRGLLEEAAKASPANGTVQQQSADYYASYMDEAGIEGRGLAPLKPMLDRYAAIDSLAALSRVLGEELRADVDALNNTNFRTERLFGVWITAALDDPTATRPYLLQGGLDLPDREYYVADSPRMVTVRKELTGHIARTLGLAGVTNAEVAAAEIVALETKMARVHAPRAESLDVQKANNPWKRAEFARKAPGLDWDAFLAGARLEKEPVIIVWHPGATRGLSALVRSEPLAAWKHWLTFRAIDRNAAVLPKAFVDERFAFHGKVLNGTPQLAERWKRGVAATNAAIPEAVGQIYVARYFPPDTKAQMQAMARNLVAAFGARIDRLAWMSPATKLKAKQKLATLRVGVGYPDSWVDYRGLQIVKGDAFGNRQRAELFDYERHLKKLGTPVDKAEWWMSPQTVNALNLPLQNALNFPAAILAPPFFDPAAPAAANYGSIGATIGHEITHSFDDQGAMFDADGRLANWWTKEDLDHFRAAGAQLASQFDAYAPFPDLHVNGTQTLSENIADVAGLAVAYDGWRASLAGAAAPEAAGFSGPQQFFLAYAQSWLIKWREPALRQAVITDGHAPPEYRADTVRNLDAWYDAFEVKPGRRLYLAPDQRVRVW
ncbi:MAG TPA: M13 family metallopeptidase [Vicinamibacterales bacterium]|jgi:predicted metalloendopeptidase|nr:M13 family metallopeptidase [Vicinamibacterales bacterium]